MCSPPREKQDTTLRALDDTKQTTGRPFRFFLSRVRCSVALVASLRNVSEAARSTTPVKSPRKSANQLDTFVRWLT
jgi:hypothetical protein